MPKMKTNSSAKKRFKVTGSGKVKRKKAGLRHNAGSKTKVQKKRLSQAVVAHSNDEAKMKRLLAIAYLNKIPDHATFTE